jgi:hypothetical protein
MRVIFVRVSSVRVFRMAVVIFAVAVPVARGVPVTATGTVRLVVREFAGVVTLAGAEECQADRGRQHDSPAKSGSHRRESRGAR